MDRVSIVPVADRRSAREFLSYPYRLYKGHPYWVPPLVMAQRELFDARRHPFYRHGRIERFLAIRSSRVVGRIAAILDPRYSEFHGERAGFFGFFDAADDEAVVSALTGAACEWLRRMGAEVIRGPVNPTTNYDCGVLVDGFDSSPRIMMTYNHPYYGPLLERAGLRKAMDLLSYDIDTATARNGRVDGLLARGAQDGLVVRPIRMAEYESEVLLAWEAYNAAWARNWGFVPLTREEFIHYSREMKPILVPSLALFAEIGGVLAGFAVAVPDINEALKHVGGRLFPFGLAKLLWHKRNIRHVRVVLLGVRPEYRATPTAASLYAQLIREARRLKYAGAECSWILEDNILMRRAIEGLGGVVTKTYRIYEV